jgi:hypothetical protein
MAGLTCKEHCRKSASHIAHASATTTELAMILKNLPTTTWPVFFEESKAASVLTLSQLKGDAATDEMRGGPAVVGCVEVLEYDRLDCWSQISLCTKS